MREQMAKDIDLYKWIKWLFQQKHNNKHFVEIN